MKIAFTGAQGTGKTSLVNALKEEPRFKDYTFFDNLIRREILKGDASRIISPDDSIQQSIARAHEKILAEPNFIADRCIIDCYVYSVISHRDGQISDDCLHFVSERVEDLIDQYDIIYYLKPEFELQDDGVRCPDPEFQTRVASVFDETIRLLSKVPNKRIRIEQLTGSLEERLSQIKETIGEGSK